MSASTVHIISNSDISLTLCGHLLVAEPDPGSTEAVRVLTDPQGQAIWDDVEYPADAVPCASCMVLAG